MVEERRTIYLVDDNTTNLTLGKNTLVKYYKVFTMNSGASLLKSLEKSIPDLILLDVEMPDMNGYEVIKIIKSKRETKDIPVIFLTAKIDGDSELEGLSLGAIDYITKPFSPSLLLKRIETHLKLVNYNKHLQTMVTAKTKSVLELQNAILKAMAELVESRDDITGKHIERTQNYLALLIGALLMRGLFTEEMQNWNIGLVLQSSQLHDVGKIAVKDEILKKNGKLTEEEFAEIKKHPLCGEEFIDKIKRNTTDHEFLKHAKIFAATHHEKWDGSGYPRGLKGKDIPLQGRLMAIADVYDALVSDRPYKKAFPHEEAVKIISDGSGTHFDPDLVNVFLEISDKFNKVTNSFGLQ
ncbi:MAG: response regulator [Fibromonadaceae bacterium]|jgi:putative two-component system response regulator|nr:response regulator [Fibromonadaceae bacterium]